MSAALSLLVAASVSQLCFVPSEQTAGWKRVDVPDDAPGLSAPADVDQFRPGEPAWLVEQDPAAYQGATRESAGKMGYQFSVPAGTRRLEVRFLEPLRGAKVDVLAYASGRAFPIWSERRVSEASAEIEWDLPRIEQVLVRVHHHLRPVPVVTQWQTARWVDLAADVSVPAAFRVTRSLYFRHPGGRTLELCDLSAQPLTVDRSRLAGAPAAVSLRRK